MTSLDPALAAWAANEFAENGQVIHAIGLRAGGPPWKLTFSGDRPRTAVLRVGDDVESLRLERAAMIWANAHGIPVPAVFSAETTEPLLLIEQVVGSSAVPIDRPVRRLERMGAMAARIHAAPPPMALPRRLRSVIGVDFDSLRRALGPHPLWDRAARAVASPDPGPTADGLVHGDLWLGNVLWSQSDRITAVIDWDCAGRGPAGVDLGSARMDAVTAYGHGAEDDVLRGWEREAGRPADDVAHWDVIACLSTPPDMGWFTTAVQQQGRTDLTAELLVERRDDFLERALAALEA